QVLWMNVPADPPPRSRAFHFFQREAHVVKQRFVGLKQRAVFFQDSDMLRKEIYELPQFVLVLSKSIFSLLTILDVGRRVLPSDVSFLIDERVVPDKKPPIFTVF